MGTVSIWTLAQSPSTTNMKFLVLFACVAAASAQLVTYPNGAVAPAKTPSVAASETAHFAAKGAFAAPYALGAYPYAAGYAGYPYAAGAYGAGYPYAGAYAHGAYPYNGAYGYAGHYGYAAPYAG